MGWVLRPFQSMGMVPRRHHLAAVRGADMSISESEREMATLVAACALTDVKRLAKAFQQFKQENYRRGFEAAKAAALEIVESERHHACDCGADFSHMLASIAALKPQATQ